MSESAKWYVVHTYSGYENAVKTSIEKFVTGRGMEDMILRIEVPMETVTEVTDSGATKEVERKVFPGYVLIKMVMTDDTWHLVRNVRGVTGFVGSANKAIPLTEEEVLAMGMEKHEIVVRYNVLLRGTEDYWLCETADPRRQGNSRAPRWSRSGPARREHRRLHQGVQRAYQERHGHDYPRGHHCVC